MRHKLGLAVLSASSACCLVAAGSGPAHWTEDVTDVPQACKEEPPETALLQVSNFRQRFNATTLSSFGTKRSSLQSPVAINSTVATAHHLPSYLHLSSIMPNRDMRRMVMISIWIVVPICLALFVWWLHHMEGADVVKRVVPIATAVSCCVLINAAAKSYGQPFHHFSPTTALITVVFVMDMGTFERFIIKVALRTLGTLAGGTLAVLGAEITELCKGHTMVPVGLCFTIFLLDAILAKRYGYMAYTFTMTSVTFALVFFGYVQRGWVAVIDRMLSVLIGEALAISCTLTYQMAFSQVMSSLSVVTIVRLSEDILKKALVAIEFAFIRNSLCSATDEESSMEILKSICQSEVLDWFYKDKEATGGELRELAKSTTFHDLPMDIAVAGMQAECRGCCADMVFLRSIFPTHIGGWRFQEELPAVAFLPERAHPLFVQASALAHSSLLDPSVWRTEGAKIDEVRLKLQDLERHFQPLFALQTKAMRASGEDRAATLKENRESALELLQKLAVSLMLCHRQLTSVRRGLAVDSHELPGGGLARFDGFCHGLGIFLSDLASLAMTFIKFLEVPEDEAMDTIGIFCSVCGLNPENVSERKEIMDVSSSKFLQHWSKVQALNKQMGHTALDEGEE